MSDSVRPHRRQPTRLLCPRDSLGKNTGVGCHFLLQSFCIVNLKSGLPKRWFLLIVIPEHVSFLLFSLEVMPDSLRPHGLQHTRLPCPSPSPGVCSNSYPLSWCICQSQSPNLSLLLLLPVCLLHL